MTTELIQVAQDSGGALLTGEATEQRRNPSGAARGEPSAQSISPRTELPQVRSLLAVVRYPGEESQYLGALMSAFRCGGAELSLLVLTGGDAGASDPPTGRLDMPRPAELEMACLALRVTTRAIANFTESDLGSLPIVELAERIDRMIVNGGTDMLLVADGAVSDDAEPDGPRVVEAVRAAAGARNLPALAWTLPHEMADKIHTETGVPMRGTPREKIDFRLRVARDAQWFAMRAYGKDADHVRPHHERLAAQGAYEWLRWLTPGPHPTAFTG